MYLLDTDHVSIVQWRTMPDYNALRQRLDSCATNDIFVSIVSFHEEVRGWNRYINRARSAAAVVKTYAKFQKLLSDFAAMQVAPFDDAAAAVFDDLKSQRIRVATMDLRIAAIALSNDYTLLTRNFSDFVRIPGLRFEDWTVPLTSTDT